MNKKQLAAFLVALFLTGVLGCALAPKGSLGAESWSVEDRQGVMFYFTHGTAVWGHEFGFYKTEDCKEDILWLSFSARDEKIRNFDGQEALISLDVDGKDVRIKSTMHYMGTIGFTQVMYFYDWAAGPVLMNALTKGRYVNIQILEPKGLEELLDIKEDRFGLKGLVNAQKKANTSCIPKTQ